MKQRMINLNNVFMLLYGFQFDTFDCTKIQFYRKEGSKIKFLTFENGEFLDCVTGQKIEMRVLNNAFPLIMKKDVQVSKDSLDLLYTPEEMNEKYVYSKGVLMGIDFQFEKTGLSDKKNCDQYKMFIKDVLPLGLSSHKLELSKFSYATYIKYMETDQIPAEKFESFENKCNSLIHKTHNLSAESSAKEIERLGKIIPQGKGNKRSKTVDFEMDGNIDNIKL